jgi:putative tricarboxylic transport membrane protein
MILANLLQGFSDALSVINILACFLGAFLGTVTGLLPGIGPAAAMSLLLPLTFSAPPATGLIMLAGIYYGAMYGGSTTSILMNMPGETASMVTCFDGYQMAKKGRAGAALAVSAIGSWVAGTVSIIGLMVFAPGLAKIALSLGPAEYFSIALLGLLLLNNLSGDSFLKASAILCVGLMISTVGTEIIYGSSRFDFGFADLLDGIDVVPVLMGLFGLSEVFAVILEKDSVRDVLKVRFRELYPTKEEIKQSIKPTIRGTLIGFFMGLLPGPAHILSTLISYKVEQGISSHPERFGKGAIEGVAGPESANNAASTSAMIPLFALGLPFTAQAAIMISALKIHGISPSPLLISQHGHIFWAVIASMYIGNVILLLLNLPLVGVFASLVKTPTAILMPIITGIMVVGAYTLKGSTFDVWLLLLSGLLGYFMKKVDYPAVPLILGLILGPMFEESLRQALILAQGNPIVFLHRPVTGVVLAFIAIVILWGVAGKSIKGFLKRRRKVSA